MAIPTHLRKKIADFDPVLDGRTVTQFCKDIGVSRQTYANIKRRVEQRGRAGILPDSTAPHSPARIYDDHLRQKVITARSLLKAQGRAVKMRVIPTNPLIGTPKPRVDKAERRYLTVEEQDALLWAAKEPAVKLMLEVLLKTGLRPGEAKGLKVRDLDVERRRLAIRRDVNDLGHVDTTKTGQHRDVPISQLMALTLTEKAEGRDGDAWLLPDERGHVWTTARWRAIWATLLLAAGIDENLKTYELRHTAVSMVIAGGTTLYDVQLMTGHADPATTVRYYGHLWQEKLDRVPEAIENHLQAERRRIESKQARRAQAEKDAGVRHLRLVQ